MSRRSKSSSNTTTRKPEDCARRGPRRASRRPRPQSEAARRRSARIPTRGLANSATRPGRSPDCGTRGRRAERAGEPRRRVMAQSDTVFAGSIPALYDRYLGPLIFEPYAADLADLADRVASGAAERVLETA